MATMHEPARSAEQRKKDTLARLETDIDAWIATADAETGTPYVMPLSFTWDGETIFVATPAANPTARNLVASGKARVTLDGTRDVVLIDGEARAVEPGELSEDEWAAYIERHGWDPRKNKGMGFYKIRPIGLQAWREVNEIKGRDLIVGGEWVV
jgi:Pyridoxamine 5'-phosphate oxidase